MKQAKAKTLEATSVEKRPGRTLTLATLEAMPAAVAESSDPVGLVNRYHEMARLSMAQSCAFMILAGFELIALKKQAKHGEWEKLFPEPGSKSARACVFQMALRTAQKYMGLADAAKKHVSELKGLPIGDVPLWQLADAQRDIVLKAAHKSGDGQTYQQLAWDWNLAKRPQGSGARGGHHPEKDDGSNDTTEDDSEEFAALNIWTPIIRDLFNEGLDKKSYSTLPDNGDVSLRTLRETVARLHADLNGHKKPSKS